VSFSFFSRFDGIRLIEIYIDPQLESTIRPKARGLHSIWNAILRIAFSIWFLRQDNTSTIEDFQEKNSGTLGNYSRRLQDYSRISWSTFKPWDVSSVLVDFWLENSGTLGDYSSRPSRLLKTILLDYKVLRGLSYGHSWAHYFGGYQDPVLDRPHLFGDPYGCP
jgi:hypothetical protein